MVVILRRLSKVPFLKDFILLSYRERSVRLVRSRNKSVLMHDISFAFRNLNNKHDCCSIYLMKVYQNLYWYCILTHSNCKFVRPWKIPGGSSEILFPYSTLNNDSNFWIFCIKYLCNCDRICISYITIKMRMIIKIIII